MAENLAKNHFREGDAPAVFCSKIRLASAVHWTHAVGKVTCKPCLRKLWREIVLAHYQQFRPTVGVGAAIAAAIRGSEPV